MFWRVTDREKKKVLRYATGKNDKNKEWNNNNKKGGARTANDAHEMRETLKWMFKKYAIGKYRPWYDRRGVFVTPRHRNAARLDG